LSQTLNETSYKVWKHINQQCSATVKHYIKCSNCLPLPLTHVLSLNHNWSLVWSMTVCWMLDQVSIRHHLNSSTSRTSCWDPLLYHCPDSVVHFIKVWDVRKPQSGCYEDIRHLVTKQLEDCVWTVHCIVEPYAGSLFSILWKMWNVQVIANLL